MVGGEERERERERERDGLLLNLSPHLFTCHPRTTLSPPRGRGKRGRNAQTTTMTMTTRRWQRVLCPTNSHSLTHCLPVWKLKRSNPNTPCVYPNRTLPHQVHTPSTSTSGRRRRRRRSPKHERRGEETKDVFEEQRSLTDRKHWRLWRDTLRVLTRSDVRRASKPSPSPLPHHHDDAWERRAQQRNEKQRRRR